MPKRERVIYVYNGVMYETLDELLEDLDGRDVAGEEVEVYKFSHLATIHTKIELVEN